MTSPICRLWILSSCVVNPSSPFFPNFWRLLQSQSGLIAVEMTITGKSLMVSNYCRLLCPLRPVVSIAQRKVPTVTTGAKLAPSQNVILPVRWWTFWFPFTLEWWRLSLHRWSLQEPKEHKAHQATWCEGCPGGPNPDCRTRAIPALAQRRWK